MKKLFLILAAATFMVACTPKSQPAATEAEEMVVVDEAIAEPEELATIETTKPAATKPTAPKTETPKAEEPKAEEPKAEEPKAEEPKAPTKKKTR
ncbi:MAG: hypothetical protein FWC34_03320 [Bacteroidetes bacterium]|nr:hypothetical protein [Bacteroidota bacterium]MCL2303656.1 hypothetical protein [Lentimicrobiaceae bacterium]